MSEWKPIETAPKSPRVIDIWSKRHGRLANYRRVKWGKDNVFYDPVQGGVCCIRDATHWMPLPEPPNKTDKECKE